MTYGNVPDYKLAEKMKSRFSGRGAALSGMQASSTSELMRRAQMGGDPSVNCAELAFQDVMKTRKQNGAYPRNYSNAADRRQGYSGGNARQAASVGANYTRGTVKTNGAGIRTERTAAGAGTATGAGAGNRPNGAVGRSTSAATATHATHATAKAKKNAKGRAKAKAKSKAKAEKKEAAGGFGAVVEEITEVKTTRRLTPMYVLFLVICTMMIMSIVVSFSEIYKTTYEIAQLESTLSELDSRAAELELKLEIKNDIPLIEQIATQKLGMVKEESVQRKYVSLSDGERIDIIDAGEYEDEVQTASGVLLSSIWSSIDNIFDYFR